jgi:ATPase family associated with various cellular activities (AAA)
MTVNTGHEETWIDTNQRYLTSALSKVRAALEQHAALIKNNTLPTETAPDIQPIDVNQQFMHSALESLCTTFGLSPFERAIVLLCAGMELDASFAELCAAAHGDPARPYPTFSLALAALAEPHWSALTPDAPLRRWRLIEVSSQTGTLLMTSPLRIDERVLHFLVGVQHLDERLVGLIEPVQASGDLVPSHAALVERIEAAWTRADGELPLIQLCGNDETSKRVIAATCCAKLELPLFSLSADLISSNASELAGLARLWEREVALTSSALYVETEAIDPTETRSVITVSRLLERVNGPLFLSTRDRWRPMRRTVFTLDIGKPTVEEQRRMWQALLGHEVAGLNGHIRELVSQFNLNTSAIRSSAQEALSSGASGTVLAKELWDASRAQSRPRLTDLAQRIEPLATWDDLVLPESERQFLREIAAHVAHKATVYESWGFGAVSNRGLGISALFAGASGTGKTMAAEVLANTLRLDLYRIDLSSVVSKYIGETEKNLRRVFDAAEDGGAILFFDEADALFGKRSEIKDSHDRYANIEVNYLLQRMELYRGLAVLATNMKGLLDPAFLRRIRFVINFPFPDAKQRAEIWQRIFPPNTPTEGLDMGKLARLNVAGGNIRNIALNAAFLAAEAGEPIRMVHLLRATRSEFAKIEKPLNEAETGGWV